MREARRTMSEREKDMNEPRADLAAIDRTSQSTYITRLCNNFVLVNLCEQLGLFCADWSIPNRTRSIYLIFEACEFRIFLRRSLSLRVS
jgi:hypothetical protein